MLAELFEQLQRLLQDQLGLFGGSSRLEPQSLHHLRPAYAPGFQLLLSRLPRELLAGELGAGVIGLTAKLVTAAGGLVLAL